MDNFTFDYYEKIFQTALENDYKVITLKEFFLMNMIKMKKY